MKKTKEVKSCEEHLTCNEKRYLQGIGLWGKDVKELEAGYLLNKHLNSLKIYLRIMKKRKRWGKIEKVKIHTFVIRRIGNLEKILKTRPSKEKVSSMVDKSKRIVRGV